MSQFNVNNIGPSTASEVNITGLNPPTYLGSELAQVDDVVLKSGGAGAIMTGLLTLSANASSNLHAVPKQQLDTEISTLGGLFTTGTFVPGLAFGGSNTGITYSSQDGRYVKVRGFLFVSVYIVLTSKGSSTGAARITNLPFTPGGVFAGDCLVDNMAITSSVKSLTAAGVGVLDLRLFNGSSGDNVTVNDTHFTNTTLIHASIGYMT